MSWEIDFEMDTCTQEICQKYPWDQYYGGEMEVGLSEERVEPRCGATKAWGILISQGALELSCLEMKKGGWFLYPTLTNHWMRVASREGT